VDRPAERTCISSRVMQARGQQQQTRPRPSGWLQQNSTRRGQPARARQPREAVVHKRRRNSNPSALRDLRRPRLWLERAVCRQEGHCGLAEDVADPTKSITSAVPGASTIVSYDVCQASPIFTCVRVQAFQPHPREEQAKRELDAAGDHRRRAMLLKRHQARAISLQIAPIDLCELCRRCGNRTCGIAPGPAEKALGFGRTHRTRIWPTAA